MARKRFRKELGERGLSFEKIKDSGKIKDIKELDKDYKRLIKE